MFVIGVTKYSIGGAPLFYPISISHRKVYTTYSFTGSWGYLGGIPSDWSGGLTARGYEYTLNADFYWSSTSSVDNLNAWSVDLYFGYVSSFYGKSTALFVRCVRPGQ
jgi:hypothetical protein